MVSTTERNLATFKQHFAEIEYSLSDFKVIKQWQPVAAEALWKACFSPVFKCMNLYLNICHPAKCRRSYALTPAWVHEYNFVLECYFWYYFVRDVNDNSTNYQNRSNSWCVTYKSPYDWSKPWMATVTLLHCCNRALIISMRREGRRTC